MKILNLGIIILLLFAIQVNGCSNSISAQETKPVLKINMKNGTNALLTVTDKMRMEFDTDHIVIQHDNDDFKVFHIVEVSSFEHLLEDKSAVNDVMIHEHPMFEFIADGIAIAQPGRHVCRVFDINGTLLLTREFYDALTINNSMLHPGNIILQIDGNKTIKIRIK